MARKHFFGRTHSQWQWYFPCSRHCVSLSSAISLSDFLYSLRSSPPPCLYPSFVRFIPARAPRPISSCPLRPLHRARCRVTFCRRRHRTGWCSCCWMTMRSTRRSGYVRARGHWGWNHIASFLVSYAGSTLHLFLAYLFFPLSLFL